MVTVNLGCGVDTWGDVRIDLKSEVFPDIIASADRLPFRSECFTVARLFSVLEHLPDPSRAIREISRCASVIDVIIPNVYYWARILRTIKRGFSIPINYRTLHLQVWDIITIHQFARLNGLEIVDHRWRLREVDLYVQLMKISE
jgi:hypothetical protein